jgi:tetratricopeptide (TPR) repeat protein
VKNKFSNEKIRLVNENYFKIMLVFLKRIFLRLNTEYFYCELATYLYKLNFLSQAINNFLKSEENNLTKNIELSTFNLAHLAFAYFDLGDYKKSKNYLEKVYSYDKTDAELIYRLAKCNEILELNNLALRYYEEVILLDEDNYWDPLAATIMLIDCDRRDEGRKFLEILKKRSTTLVEKNITEGIELIFHSKYLESQTLLEKTLILLREKAYAKYKPNISTLISLYFGIFHELNIRNFSLKLFEEEYKVNKSEPYLNFLLAKEYYDRNIQLHRAIKMIDISIKKNKLNPYYFNLKALILFKMRKYKKAERVIKKNLLNHPDDNDSKELLIKISKAIN